MLPDPKMETDGPAPKYSDWYEFEASLVRLPSAEQQGCDEAAPATSLGTDVEAAQCVVLDHGPHLANVNDACCVVAFPAKEAAQESQASKTDADKRDCIDMIAENSTESLVGTSVAPAQRNTEGCSTPKAKQAAGGPGGVPSPIMDAMTAVALEVAGSLGWHTAPNGGVAAGTPSILDSK